MKIKINRISNVENVDRLLTKEIEDLRSQTNKFNSDLSNNIKNLAHLTNLKLALTLEKTEKMVGAGKK